MLTLGEARILLAPFCGTGKSPDDPSVPSDINEAIERIMNKPENWSYLTQYISMCAPNGQLTLPREVAKILKSRINGNYAEVQSRWFEMCANGPGLLGTSMDATSPMVDRGFVPTQYDIPHSMPMLLMIVSDMDEDPDAKLLIRGHDETGREVRTGNTQWGELVPIKGGSASEAWITEHKFSDIISIQKPRTKGYVYISAIEPVAGIRYHLASLHPDETIPHYRRYFARETPCVKGTVLPVAYRISALVRLQYVPAVHDSDMLIVQNFGAIKMMLKAIRLEDAEKLNDATGYEAKCMMMMREQTEMLEDQESVIDVAPGFNGGPIDQI